MFTLNKSKTKFAKPAGIPTADDGLAATRALIDKLQGQTSLPVLGELAAHLDGLRADDRIRPVLAYEAVDMVDRSARTLYRKAAHEYVLGQRKLTKFQDEQLWSAVGAYLNELCQGYRYCLAKFEVGAEGSGELAGLLPLMTARAVRLCAARLKWSYLRYRPPEPRQWEEIDGLYLLAEAADYSRASVSLYRGAASETSVEQEFLKALMLAAASPASLTPEQVEVAERVVARIERGLTLAAEPGVLHHHFIDLRSDAGPRRLATVKRVSETSRTFGAPRGIGQLQALDKALEDERLTPRELALSPEFDVEIIQATLRHLIRHWGPPLPVRRHERQRQSAVVTVVHGFDEVTASVGGLTVDYPFVSEQEQWRVENESRSGMQLAVASPHGRWVQVGSLIAFRKHDDATWITAVVRRVQRQDDDTRRVGVEIVAHGGAGVTILPLATPSRRDVGEGVLCALLSAGETASDEVLLLLPARMFSPAAAREMRAYDRRYRLVPVQLLESHEDYQIARYKVLRLVD
jgi:cyclic-di-GMP-binding protein